MFWWWGLECEKFLLCIFITRGAGKVRKGTLLLWLFGLELWHMINGAPGLGKSQLAHAVM